MLRMGFARSLRSLGMTMEGEANCHSEARRCRAVGILWVSGLCKVEFFAPKGAQNDRGWDSRGRCAPSE